MSQEQTGLSSATRRRIRILLVVASVVWLVAYFVVLAIRINEKVNVQPVAYVGLGLGAATSIVIALSFLPRRSRS
jgi:hypothetical protein